MLARAIRRQDSLFNGAHLQLVVLAKASLLVHLLDGVVPGLAEASNLLNLLTVNVYSLVVAEALFINLGARRLWLNEHGSFLEAVLTLETLILLGGTCSSWVIFKQLL